MLPRRGERLQWTRACEEEKKKDNLVYCYGRCTGQFTEAVPGIACSSGQNMVLVLGSPSWPQTSGVHWHPLEVCIVTSLKAPVLEQIGWAAPRWGVLHGKCFWGIHLQHWEKTCGHNVTHICHLFHFVEISVNAAHSDHMYIFVQSLQSTYQILVYGKWHGIRCLVNLLCNPNDLRDKDRPALFWCKIWLVEIYCAE